MPSSRWGETLDLQSLFASQEEDDEEAASLADVLEVLIKQWPKQFTAGDVAALINNPSLGEDAQTVRDFLVGGAPSSRVFSAKSVGRHLKEHVDGPVKSGGRTLVLRSYEDKHSKMRFYNVAIIPAA